MKPVVGWGKRPPPILSARASDGQALGDVPHAALTAWVDGAASRETRARSASTAHVANLVWVVMMDCGAAERRTSTRLPRTGMTEEER